MKRLIDGYFRLEEKDFEILEFCHEQYFGANLHFKMICQDEPYQSRVRELLNLRFLEKRHWKDQTVDYFTLAYKGFKALKRRIYRAHLMPMYKVPQGLNNIIGERLKAGLVRLIFKQIDLNDWTSERILKIRDRKIYPVPTGELKINNQKIAVHFEPICKRPVKAYGSLFKDYLKTYDQICVIVDWNIQEFLSKAEDEFKSQPSNIWFMDYSDLVKKSGETHLYGFKGRNCLLSDLVNGAHQP